MILRDRTALITGCSRGIGPHIARRLAREGVHVVLTARTAPPLEALAAELTRAHGVRAAAVPADLLHPAERVDLLTRATAAAGPIDILVNNAAVEHAGPFPTLADSAMDELVHLNILAPWHLTQLVLPGMLARHSGAIVNLGSLGGKKAVAFDAAYGGSKAAVIEWTNALRAELWDTGVRLSAVCPGYVTGEGMFARFGVVPPRIVGSCTPRQVADAVIRAIRTGAAEIVVNSMPVRPYLATYAMWPRLFDLLPRITGLTAFQRRKVGRTE